jgi:hypothetical protein
VDHRLAPALGQSRNLRQHIADAERQDQLVAGQYLAGTQRHREPVVPPLCRGHFAAHLRDGRIGRKLRRRRRHYIDR